MIKWKVDVWKELTDRGINTYQMLKNYGGVISQYTMMEFKKEHDAGESNPVIVTMKTINALCKLLDCQPGDLLEYVDEK